MTLETTGTMEMNLKVQYLRTLVHGEELCQFELLYADVENTDISLSVGYLIKVLEWYFLLVDSLSKQKRTMCQCMKKPRNLKVKLYAAYLIDLNEYLASFPWETMADKIVVTELNEIFLNSMPDRWSKQAGDQCLNCESISFFKAVNMFERMEIVEIIYEGVTTPS